MTDSSQPESNAIEELKLVLQMRDGEYCAARVGVSLTLYYGKPMRELAEAARRLVDCYLAFIPDGAIISALSASGIWRSFTKEALTRSLRRWNDEGAHYSSINLSSGQPRNVGEYGVHFFGSNFLNEDLYPRETCACIFQFPVAVLDGNGSSRFKDFVSQIADLESFESGHAGFTFNYLFVTWPNQAHSWVAQQAPRHIGIDIGYDQLSKVARQRVVNVSWITLLSSSLVQDLGGELKLRERLLAEIAIRPLKSGVMLIAGAYPPIGDVSRGATDMKLVREVARLTKPVRAQMTLGFGGGAFRNGWLNRLD